VLLNDDDGNFKHTKSLAATNHHQFSKNKLSNFRCRYDEIRSSALINLMIIVAEKRTCFSTRFQYFQVLATM